MNSRQPVPIENDYMAGHVLFLAHTDKELAEYNQQYGHLFEGKCKKFEMQFQVRFKHIPAGATMMIGTGCILYFISIIM